MESEADRWRKVWAFYEEHEDALKAVSQQASQALDAETYQDVLHEFALQRIPNLMSHVERIPDERRGAYVRAAFRNFVRDRYRQQLRRRETLVGSEPIGLQGDAPHAEIAIDVARLAAMLEQLTPLERRALRCFADTNDGYASIRAVARELGVPRSLAERTLERALASLSLLLMESKATDADGYAGAAIVLRDGLTIREATQRCAASEPKIRRAVRALQQAARKIVREGNRND